MKYFRPILPAVFGLVLAAHGAAAQTPAATPSSNSPAAATLRASTLAFSQGNYAEARRLLLQARALDSSIRNIDYQLAAIAYGTEKLEEAERLLKTSLAAGEAVADCNNLLGALALRAGHPVQAIEYFQAAIKADPTLAQAHANLGLAYRSHFEPGKAVAPLRKAAELNKPAAAVYQFQARLAMIEAGQAREIEETLAKKLTAPEADADWVLTAAAIDLRKGRIEEGAERLRQARAAMPPALFAAMLQDRAFKMHAGDTRIAAFYHAP